MIRRNGAARTTTPTTVPTAPVAAFHFDSRFTERATKCDVYTEDRSGYLAVSLTSYVGDGVDGHVHLELRRIRAGYAESAHFELHGAEVDGVVAALQDILARGRAEGTIPAAEG